MVQTMQYFDILKHSDEGGACSSVQKHRVNVCQNNSLSLEYIYENHVTFRCRAPLQYLMVSVVFNLWRQKMSCNPIHQERLLDDVDTATSP